MSAAAGLPSFIWYGGNKDIGDGGVAGGCHAAGLGTDGGGAEDCRGGGGFGYGGAAGGGCRGDA